MMNDFWVNYCITLTSSLCLVTIYFIFILILIHILPFTVFINFIKTTQKLLTFVYVVASKTIYTDIFEHLTLTTPKQNVENKKIRNLFLN